MNWFKRHKVTDVEQPEVKPTFKYIKPTKAEQRKMLTMSLKEARKYLKNRIPNYILINKKGSYFNFWSKTGPGFMSTENNLKYGEDYINLEDLYEYPFVEFWGVETFLDDRAVGEKLTTAAHAKWRKYWDKRLK